jgi:hypothetical protein
MALTLVYIYLLGNSLSRNHLQSFIAEIAPAAASQSAAGHKNSTAKGLRPTFGKKPHWYISGSFQVH